MRIFSSWIFMILLLIQACGICEYDCGTGYTLIYKSSFACHHNRKDGSSFINLDTNCSEKEFINFYLETRTGFDLNWKLWNLTEGYCEKVCKAELTRENVILKILPRLAIFEEKNRKLEYACIKKEVEEKLIDFGDMEYISSCIVSDGGLSKQCKPVWKFWDRGSCGCAYRIKTKLSEINAHRFLINLYENKCSEEKLSKLKKH